MDMFKMIKEAAQMRSKLAELDRTLKDKVVEIDENGVKIKVNAKSEVLDLKISEEVLKKDAARVEKDILAALQKAMKRSHDLMAEEAKKLTGGMSIPGLT